MKAIRGLIALAALLQGVQVDGAATATLSSSYLGMTSMSMQKLKTSMRMRIKSKASIMAGMTEDLATKVVLGMNQTHQQPELVALLQTKFGSRVRRRSMLRTSSRSSMRSRMEEDSEEGSEEEESDDEPGYSQLQEAKQGGQKSANAKKMLNTMLSETAMKLELNEFKCHTFEEKQMGMMESTRQDVASFNSLAAEARGYVLKAQGNIGLLNIKLGKAREELAEHNKQCETDVMAIKASLKIVLADIEVMAKILELTTCNSLLLMQCAHCNGQVLIQHDHVDVQGKLNSLQSQVARMYSAQSLQQTFLESQEHPTPVALVEETSRLRHIVGHRHHHRHGHRHHQFNSPAFALNTSDVPEAPVVAECIPTNRCTIGNSPNCQKLKDRFLVIQAAIVDKKNQLSDELVEKENFCSSTAKEIEGSINGMEERLKEEQTNFAVATKDQNDAESSSHLKAQQHATLLKEYSSTMKECCDDSNEYKSEICALEKIRGEVDKLAGSAIYTTDCEVSEWREEECSRTCGGGKMQKTRTVIVHPVGDGMECLPLEAEQECNSQPCPVDCITWDWGGWSACSAECGGGVRERSRGIRVEAAHDGDPCEATEETEPCAMQSCDSDCELGDWTEWSSCSKACDSGMQRRQKPVAEPARGTGTCSEVESPERLEFMPCNIFSCESLVTGDRETLTCESKVDIVLMIDGSGSLGQNGWDKSIIAAKSIIDSLNGGDDKVKVSVQLFSGPKTWADYHACTSSDPNVKVDTSAQCGITWVEHFTSDTSSLSTAVGNLEWPRASTMTSVALGEAEAELMYGRGDANAVVICITDGWPMSPWNTYYAAKRLKEKASLIWVPVGANAPLDLIHHLASLPQSDHIVQVDTFEDLEKSETINKIIADTCPVVGR